MPTAGGLVSPTFGTAFIHFGVCVSQTAKLSPFVQFNERSSFAGCLHPAQPHFFIFFTVQKFKGSKIFAAKYGIDPLALPVKVGPSKPLPNLAGLTLL